MDKAFSNLLKHLGNLNPTQKEQAYQWLKRYVDSTSSVGGRLIDEMRETRFKEGFECPHCTSVHVVRFGKFQGRQRYKCKACNKTFNDLTNTILYRIRKTNQWIAFIECMIKGYSLRKSAKIIGGITHVTLFYWRHKLLSALKQLDFKQFEGIVEVDETYFLYSEKGKRSIGRKSRKRGGSAKKRGISNEQVCVLVARDRAKSTVSKVTCMGRVVKSQVDKVIGSKLHEENVLVTDAWRAYKTYAKEKGLEHYRIKSDDGNHVIKGIYHIQNVNSLHSRLKKWIDRFKGVASKYLDNYLAWFLFVDRRGHESTKQNIKDMILSSFPFEVNATYKSIRLANFTL